MNVFESIRVAWNGLVGNKLRSGLTMLGVIIGVTAVIALVSIGQGARQQVTAQIQGLGSNMIMITARGATGRLYVEDTADLLKRVPELSTAIPDVSRQYAVKWGSNNYTTTIEGTAPGYEEIRNHRVVAGRFLIQADIDQRRHVAVIGQTVYTDLFGERNPVGEQILINGSSFTVVGLLEEKGQGLGQSYDDRVIIPISTAQRLMGTNRVQMILAQTKQSGDATQAVARITAIYQKKFPTRNPGTDDAINVQSQDQLLTTVNTATQTMTLMLGGIAGVSLVVGGIGIMNIMLVSVTERTREIGIRKAIGAKRRDILTQFLVESMILSLTGGMVGVALGVGVGRLGTLAGIPSAVSMASIIVAFVFSAAVGLFFGIYPAMQAAALDPIEALRYE
ncbi:MAG TPA: ABC transporter permease [Bacillota bacterium]|jgi:putative ABC transport system permease protein